MLKEIKILDDYEILKGMLVTVVGPVASSNRSYQGTPLEVVAVDLPFAVFRDLTGGHSQNIYFRVDDWRMKEVSREYVNAVIGKD